MGRRAVAEPDLRLFWKTIRELLYTAYGQAGGRSKERMSKRSALAAELGLEDGTIRCFLNGAPETLGAGPLQRLLAKCPGLARLYRHHYELAMLFRDPVNSQVAGWALATQEPMAIQLTLQLDGFDPKEQLTIFKLQPDSEGAVTIKVKAG
jgi:hypothetical protein